MSIALGVLKGSILQEQIGLGTDRALAGKVALVTGGGSGIGAECVKLFARAGARIVVADIDLQAASLLVQSISSVTEAVAVQTDVSEPEDCRRMVETAMERFGQLDIAVNNAGVSDLVPHRITESSFEDWRCLMSINVDGVFLGMQHQIAAMLPRGSGVIINISSIMGVVAGGTSAAYAASKHGVVGLTKAAAIEYASDGIRVNAVGPGFIDTPFLKEGARRNREKIEQKHPMARLAQAEEVAQVVGFLSSSAASFVTGAYYPVDGGYTAQ